MSKIKTYQEQVQEVIQKGIDTVEKQHKTLAERPFELAEKLEKEAKTYSIQSVRAKHDDYATTAYETLRVWNKRLGDYASSLINRFDKEAQEEKSTSQGGASKSKPAAKKQSSAAKKGTTAKKSTASQQKQESEQPSA